MGVVISGRVELKCLEARGAGMPSLLTRTNIAPVCMHACIHMCLCMYLLCVWYVGAYVCEAHLCRSWRPDQVPFSAAVRFMI